MKKLAFILSLFAVTAFAAGELSTPNGIISKGHVSVGTAASAAGAAILDVVSTTQGLAPPRMTTTQMNAIASPFDGLVIYNTTAHAPYAYENGTWTTVGAAAVSSVGLAENDGGSIFNITNTPITSSGNLGIGFASVAPHFGIFGPTSGGSTVPTSRLMVGSDLPNPSSSSLGGVQSIASVSHDWIFYIDTSGVPHLSQPGFTDISGRATSSQVPTDVAYTDVPNVFTGTSTAQTLGTTNALAVEITNDTSTGSSNAHLVKLTSVPAVVLTAITDTSGAVGIVVLGGGTSGTAYIAQVGAALCVFDNTATAGDYVQISSSTAGDCHDAGSTKPTLGQVIGVVTASGAGTKNVILSVGSGGGSGSVTTVSVASANGLTGTVANASTTPALTLSTYISGILKGNGTAISQASSATDYSPGTGALATGVLKSTTGTGAHSIASVSDITGLFSTCSGTQYLGADGSCHTAAASGVTSVALTVPPFFSVTGSPVTSSGTLAASYSGSALPASVGGTAQTSIAASFISFFESVATQVGDLIFGGASGTPTVLHGNVASTIAVLTSTGSGGVATAPVWMSGISAIAISTDWSNALAITLNNFGTVTGSNIWSRRVGDSLQVRGTFASGTVASGAASIQIPLTIDTTKLSSTANIQKVGEAKRLFNGSTPQQDYASGASGAGSALMGLFYDGSTTNQLFWGSLSASGAFIKMPGNSTNNTDVWSVDFTVPISTWSSATIGTGQGTVVLQAKGQPTGGGSSGAVIIFPTVVKDTQIPAAYNATTGEYTAPTTGFYTVLANLAFSNAAHLYAYVNGTIDQELSYGVSNVGYGGAIVSAQAGQTIDVRPDANIGATGTASSLSISLVSGNGGAGLSSLNGLTGTTQTFATGTTGSNFNIVSSGSTHTFNLPNSSSSNTGLLTSTDWSTFNSKLSSSRQVLTGVGLTGGGDLSADRTLSVLNTPASTQTAGFTLSSSSAFLYYPTDTSGGAFTINLPAANAVPNGWYRQFHDIAGAMETHPITFHVAGSDLVCGLNQDKIYYTNFGDIKFQSDGSSKWIITTSSKITRIAFAASGTYVAQPCVTDIKIRARAGAGGAGGGGSGSNGGTAANGGGAGGGGSGGSSKSSEYPFSQSPGSSYTITIGAGGAGGAGAAAIPAAASVGFGSTGTAGNAGGTTSFSTIFSVFGDPLGGQGGGGASGPSGGGGQAGGLPMPLLWPIGVFVGTSLPPGGNGGGTGQAGVAAAGVASLYLGSDWPEYTTGLGGLGGALVNNGGGGGGGGGQIVPGDVNSPNGAAGGAGGDGTGHLAGSIGVAGSNGTNGLGGGAGGGGGGGASKTVTGTASGAGGQGGNGSDGLVIIEYTE